jgi:hypothetical protein
MSEQDAGGSTDRDEDVPTAEEVLTTKNGVDEAAEKAKDPAEPMIGNIKKRRKDEPPVE